MQFSHALGIKCRIYKHIATCKAIRMYLLLYNMKSLAGVPHYQILIFIMEKVNYSLLIKLWETCEVGLAHMHAAYTKLHAVLELFEIEAL